MAGGFQKSLFFTAAENGDIQSFERQANLLVPSNQHFLLPQAVENVGDPMSRTVLHHAAMWGKTDFCKYLLEDLEADVDSKDEQGMLISICGFCWRITVFEVYLNF